MRIAVLGWGSLVWNPDGLPCDGQWRQDGPTLPIEFSRISPDGRLTLIVDPSHGAAVVTCWTFSQQTSLEEAVNDLARREACEGSAIGYAKRNGERSSLDRFPQQVDVTPVVQQWSAASSFDAVLWTALPATFAERTGTPFSVGAALDYLDSLTGQLRRRSLEYVRRAPATTHTPLRARFEADPRFGN